MFNGVIKNTFHYFFVTFWYDALTTTAREKLQSVSISPAGMARRADKQVNYEFDGPFSHLQRTHVLTCGKI